MRDSYPTVCVQAVHNLRTDLLRAVGLHTVSAELADHPVYETTTYTSSKPTFVLGLVHRFFTHLTEVTTRLMPTIHSTYNNDYKYKLRIKL